MACVSWVEEAWKRMRVLSLNDLCGGSRGLDRKLPVTGLEGTWKCPRAACRCRPCAPYCGVGVRRAVSPLEKTTGWSVHRWGFVSVSPQSAEGRTARLARAPLHARGTPRRGAGSSPGGGGPGLCGQFAHLPRPSALARGEETPACPNHSSRRSAALIPPV